jgi:hypothetical protein
MTGTSNGDRVQNDLPQPVEVFISYSHKDDRMREELETHLSLLQRQGVIAAWHDRRITAGREWAGAINEQLNRAAVILLLISARFLASNYCYDREMTRALERHKAGEARVIPVILRPVDWHGAPFGHLQALPKDGKPIIKWSLPDEGYQSVAEGIRKAVEEIRAKHLAGPLPAGAATGETGLHDRSLLHITFEDPVEEELKKIARYREMKILDDDIAREAQREIAKVSIMRILQLSIRS